MPPAPYEIKNAKIEDCFASRDDLYRGVVAFEENKVYIILHAVNAPGGSSVFVHGMYGQIPPPSSDGAAWRGIACWVVTKYSTDLVVDATGKLLRVAGERGSRDWLVRLSPACLPVSGEEGASATTVDGLMRLFKNRKAMVNDGNSSFLFSKVFVNENVFGKLFRPIELLGEHRDQEPQHGQEHPAKPSPGGGPRKRRKKAKTG